MQLSLLDNDFYNFTMGQLIWKYFPDDVVSYKFTNRSKATLAGLPMILVSEKIKRISRLRFTHEEIKYLRKLGLFEEGYLQFLSSITQPTPTFGIVEGELEISYEGPWASSVFLETPILAAVNEQYAKKRIENHNEGLLRLMDVAKALEGTDIRIIEFGTRRRFSAEWQCLVVGELADRLPDNLIGTSNVLLAKDLGLPPSGTMAHQLLMCSAALCGGPITAQHLIMDWWEKMYDDRFLIALTDTFGTDFFLRKLEPERAQRWRGMRQDSGDPFVIGAKILDYYEKNGVNAKDKTLVFSDGLTLKSIFALQEAFSGATNVVFGWGTSLTNNMGVDPLSIVIKPTHVNGLPVVKLSDNLAKAMGPPATIDLYRLATGYDSDYTKDCVY